LSLGIETLGNVFHGAHPAQHDNPAQERIFRPPRQPDQRRGSRQAGRCPVDLSREHAALDAGADRDDFVGIDALMRRLPMSLRAVSMTFGMRVMPPTSTSSSTFEMSRMAVAQTSLDGLDGTVNEFVAKLFRVSPAVTFDDMLRPAASAVMNGRLISYSVALESAILASRFPL